jgi:hypothetical protein
MNYIQRTLLKDETIGFATKPHWAVFLSAVGIFILGCVVWWILIHFGMAHDADGHGSIFMWIVWLCFAATAIQWVRMWIFHHFSDYGITNKRAVMKVGWIARDAFETFLERIEGTRIEQSILGRILGYGTLIVIGTGGTFDSFSFVPNVLQFRHKLQQAIDEAINKNSVP